MSRFPALSSCVLTLSSLGVAQVANDECTGAILVVNGANGPFSNLGASTSLPAWPCGGGGGPDVWFRYVARCTGVATFTTCGTNLDTVIQAFDANSCGNDCANGFPGGGPCNDDSCSVASSVTLAVVTGGQYYIRVAGFGGGVGSFPLNVTCTTATLPADDQCAGATPVVLGLNGPFSNVGYTLSQPAWSCTTGDSDRWFAFRATCTAPHTFDLCDLSTNFDTTLEVFSGTCACNLVSLGCNDDTCGSASQVTVNLTQNQVYRIRVGGYLRNTGAFSLNIQVGTNTGAFTNLGGQCGGAAHTGITIAATGSPNINGTVNLAVSGQTGVPLIGLGFAPLGAPYFCCTIGHSFGAALLASPQVTLPVPCDPTLIGGSLYAQGIDFGGNGGCATTPQLNLTDTVQITIG